MATVKAMKIGIYGRIFLKPGSGIVKYSFELTKHLLRNDKKNEYVIYVNKDHVPKLDFKGNYTVRKVNLPYPLWRTKLFTDLLDRDKIDVYHSMAYTLPLVPKSQRKVALVSTFHGLHSEYFNFSLKETAYWLLNYRTAARFADRIISVSDTQRHEIHEKYGFPLNRIDVTYFGVEKGLHPLNVKDRHTGPAYVRKRYKLGSSDYVIYVGGGMALNKNIDTILKAWSILKHKYGSTIQLVLTRVDMGKLAPRLKELDLEDGRDVIGLTWVYGKDLQLLYGCAILSVYPSIYEGLGFPIIEAMACGTPVITSKASALPEAAGGAALLVDKPADPEEWAEKIHGLSQNKRKRDLLRKKGLIRAKEFTWESVVKQTINSYNKAVNQVR